MKLFFIISLLLQVLLLPKASYAADASGQTIDYRTIDFAGAIGSVEYILNAQTNAGIEVYNLRYAANCEDPMLPCASDKYQGVTFQRAYQIVDIANHFVSGDIRLEIDGSGSKGKAYHAAFVISHPDSAGQAVSLTSKDLSGVPFSSARDFIVTTELQIFDAIWGKDRYLLAVTDPATGNRSTFDVADRSELAGVLDSLGAGGYELKLDSIHSTDTGLTQYVRINKLLSDVTPATADIQLSWQAPVAREDGTSLAASDIKGFKIFIWSVTQNDQCLIRETTVNGGLRSNVSLPAISKGQYFAAVSSIDNAGQIGEMSDFISFSVD